MASLWIPEPELAWRLHAECPAPCVLFQSVRDEAGTLLDFQWGVLNPAAEVLVRDLGLERSLSSWATVVEGLPARMALGQVVEEGQPLSFELGCRPGGTERWFRAQAMKQGDGFSLWLFDITGVHATRRSLHEALEREQALRAREEHLRLALETAGMVTWEWAEARRTVTWSPNVDLFFGQPPGGTGDSLASFLACVHPNDRTRVSEAIAQGLLARGPYSFLFRGLWADGSVRCYEAVGRTFHESDRPSRLLGVVMDCTERERAQAALREAEERYRLATWATNDVLWDWSPITDHIHWGEASLSLFGYPPEEMGDLTWWTEQLHPEDRRRVLEGLNQVVESDGDSWSAEYRFLRKDGTYAHVLDRGLVARDAQGRATRMIGSMMDITERKRTLERMEEEAQFRERFIGILGHDLRNPLNAISLSARALRRRGRPRGAAAGAAHRGVRGAHGEHDLRHPRPDAGAAVRGDSAGPEDRACCTGCASRWWRSCRRCTRGAASPSSWRARARACGTRTGWPGREQPGGQRAGARLAGRHRPRRRALQRARSGQVLEIHNRGPPIPSELLATLFDPFRQVSRRQ